MNWDQIAGTWRRFRGKVKEKLGRLTGSDRMTFAGKRDQFAGELQQEYGSAKAQSNKQFGPGAPVLIPLTNPTLPGTFLGIGVDLARFEHEPLRRNNTVTADGVKRDAHFTDNTVHAVRFFQQTERGSRT